MSIHAEGAGRSTSAIWNHMMMRIPVVVSENVVNLAEVGMSQRAAEKELRAAAGPLASTLSRHFRHTPRPSDNSSSAPPASIEGLMDIEESIWAPRYGLKGFIDATVLIRQLGKGVKHAAFNSTSTGKLGMAALEFKSGKEHHSHRAQLGTYGLLLQSRYGIVPAGGLLWYSKAEDMEFESMNLRDVAGVSHLAHAGIIATSVPAIDFLSVSDGTDVASQDIICGMS
jgi:DNA replication ATP-dependent helicase Dna2